MLNKSLLIYLDKKVDMLENFCQRIDKGVITSQELDDMFYNLKDEIKSKLKQNTDEWRFFDNWSRKYNMRLELKPGTYAVTKDKDKIIDLIGVLKDLLNNNKQYSPTKEKTFTSNQGYEANRYILNILKAAKEKVIIIDNYLDESVFDFIDSLNDNINIFLITDAQKKSFKCLYLSLRLKKNKVCAKYNNKSHDRYIIIDDLKFYHLGASLNTIGKKEFMINQIESGDEKQIKLNNFNDWWNKGADIS